MSLFSVAFLLPFIFWSGGPQSAPVLIRAGVRKIVAPADQLSAWRAQSAIDVSAADPAAYEKLAAPGTSFKSSVASATREPWVISNGWHYLRKPNGHFFYEAPEQSAALAAAEAFVFAGEAMIHTDDAGLPVLRSMLDFLAAVPHDQLKPVADVAFIDDGSATAAECLNLLIRRNIMAESTAAAASEPRLQVVLGSASYPKKDASNPAVFAQQVREHLSDEKRSLRIYGSNVVVGRLAAGGGKTRVFLINYGAGKYSIEGLRCRVLGHYSKAHLYDPELAAGQLSDPLFDTDATEFTIAKLKTLAVIDLTN